MKGDFQAPVFWREMRMASRRGCWRWSWKWLAGSVLGALIATVAIPEQVARNPFLLVQLLGFVGGAVMALMPLGFAADRAAGQQSLLSLTGLGPLRVFLESVAASLWMALELGLLAVPMSTAVMALHQARAVAVPWVMAFPLLFVLWVASAWILGVSVGRTRSTAVQVSLLAGSLLVVTAAAEYWLKDRIPGWMEGAFFVMGGGSDWMKLGDAYQPRGSFVPLVRVLARLAGWSVLYLAAAAWWFQLEWRRMESGSDAVPRWLGWVQSATRGERRGTSDENPYVRRFPLPTVWRTLRWMIGAFFLGLGAILAVSWTWMALPLLLLLWIAFVDVLAHIAVSGVPAADRRSGALELIFTTPLLPGRLLDAGTVAGREVVSNGMLPGIGLAGAFLALGLMAFDPAEYPQTEDRLVLATMLLWPALYAVSLCRLPFRVPVSQAVNTGEPFHSFAFPMTPVLLPAGLGGLVWAVRSGSEDVRWIGGVVGLVVLLGMLVARRRFAWNEGLDDEGLRTVAAAPIPVEGVIPKDGRITRPWVPEGFQR